MWSSGRVIVGKFAVLLLLIAGSFNARAAESKQPNILWISAEDHGPHLGCYGDAYASTPQLDAFAETGLRYLHASSNAPVCAAARTTLIAGMYGPSLGAQHMRSRVAAPDWLRLFPAYLRDAGYYTTNNVKEDYNLVIADKGWDESSRTAHWKNRREGQPFFAVFNLTESHESQIRNKNPNPRHDPAAAPVPPYHPDRPEVREDWAQYYDRVSEVDTLFGERLTELREAGLWEDTIVFFWADHGSGMPRHKRYPGWSGLHVPLLVHVPETFKHLAPDEYEIGGVSRRLVSFVDFAPTMLSIAGIEPAEYHQGHAFMGQFEVEGASRSFGFRGRMDERPDFCRSVFDGRYVYIRNFYPHLPHGQYLDYQQQTDTTRIWYQLYRDGRLNETQSAFWEPHPPEELYDLENDPHETDNLASKRPNIRNRMRRELEDHMVATRDLGVVPESSGRYDGKRMPRLVDAFRSGDQAGYRALLGVINEQLARPRRFDANVYDEQDEQQYWKCVEALWRGGAFYEEREDWLARQMSKAAPFTVIAAAEAVAMHTRQDSIRRRAVDTLLRFADAGDVHLIQAIHAFNALDHLHDEGHVPADKLGELQTEFETTPDWAESYLPNLRKRYE